MPENPATIGNYRCGPGEPLLVIAGPCVLETPDLALRIATRLVQIAAALPIQLMFKASFDKANRTSLESYRGPGLDAGLEILARVKRETGLPITTDIHESYQAAAAGQVCDLLQIPAFLARQTDLLVAAARTGRAVHVKKAQFLAPATCGTSSASSKPPAATTSCSANEARSSATAGWSTTCDRSSKCVPLGTPIVFDATHSVQEPGGLGNATGGNRAMIEPLARAAVAIGVDGLFFETHPTPETSPSDGPNMVPLDEFAGLLGRLLKIRQTVESLSS